MDMDSYEHGVPSWVDLGTPDLDGAVAFYGALFGWDAPEGDPEAGGYRVCTLRGRTVAGLGPQQNPGPPFWSSYVNVENADAIASAVTSAGGQVIMPPFDVMDAGRMGIFMDPVGAFFGVWQPGMHKGAGIVNVPGAWCWSELTTTDVAASERFYGEVFGWTAKTEGGYTEFQVAGRSVAGMMPKPDTMPAEVPPYWGIYFAVDDADKAVARITELGGSVMVPPMDIEPGRFAVVADPAGAAFSVLKMKEELGS